LKDTILKKRYFAHSLEGRPEDEWHSLDEHLKSTAELAKSFADVFGSGEWAYLAGLWHENNFCWKGF
jgi:CRISPR-associated endonuclease/helicase Cas3